MTYFNQLKEKYPDDVKKAYKEYILSKTLYRVFYYDENSPKEVKEAMNIQKTINKYCEQLIEENGNSKSLMEVLNLNTNNISDYISKNSEIFDFLEIEKGTLIPHLTGFFEMKLNNSLSKINWENLENIIKEENNNEVTLNEHVIIDRLKEISEKYAITSITYGKVRATETAINKLDKSCNQLKKVVECDDKQVGLNKFNLFLDVSEFSYAGNACEYFNGNQIRLYLNERLSHDSFAHEWLHGIDMLMDKVKKTNSYLYSIADQGIIKELLDNLNVQHKEDIIKIKETILKDTINYTEKIVDRFDLLGSINEPENLKVLLKSKIKEIQQGIFKEEDILESINSYMKDQNGCSSFILTELSMLNKFIQNQDEQFKHSYFLEYAKEMQKSLEKTGLIKDEYSTLKEEKFARAFESFVQVKLKENGLDNNIAHANVSAWTPSEIETIRQKDVWEKVLVEIRDSMNKIKPIEKNLEIKKDNVRQKISTIRKNLITEENAFAIKIK